MSDPAPGMLPGHLHLTDFTISLEPGDATHPLRPVVQGLRLRVSAQGLHRLAQAVAAEADRRAPVGIQLKDVRVGPQGIDLVMRMEKSIFRSDLATRLVLSAPGGQELRIALTDIEMPSWVPLDMLLDEAAKRGGGGVRRDPENGRALLLDPAALLARLGVPGRFAPGRWDVTTDADGLDLTFRESAGSA
ncbi:MAG: hypothetical protein M3Q50_04700 [Chloroflexota bacterium]|nr:hypothetical protein [Chloroflexota bacterium]